MLRRVRRDRLFVSFDCLGADQRPAVLRCTSAGTDAERRTSRGLKRKLTQRLCERDRIAMWHEHAVDCVVNNVAVAGYVAGNYRRAGREGLGKDHAEALPTE